jgi:hypothetical protein
VRFQKLAQVELGRLQDLGFSDVDVLQGEDTLIENTDKPPSAGRLPCDAYLGGLLNLSANALGHELLDQILQFTLALPLHDLHHLGSDLSDLSRLGVGSLLDLLTVLSGEGDGEQSDEVAVGSSNIQVGLDQRLPLSDQGSELVGSQRHAVERGQAVLALDVLDPQLDLSEALVLILVQVAQRKLDDSALEGVVGVLETLRSVDQGLTDGLDLEDGRGLDVVPVCAREKPRALVPLSYPRIYPASTYPFARKGRPPSS